MITTNFIRDLQLKPGDDIILEVAGKLRFFELQQMFTQLNEICQYPGLVMTSNIDKSSTVVRIELRQSKVVIP